MTENKYAVLGDQIYNKIGGPENVDSLIHCMTRLRIKVKDMSKVDIDDLKKVNGVLGVVDAETLEVVLGPGVNAKVATEMTAKVGVKEGEKFPSTSANSYQASKNEVEQKAAEVHAAHKASLKKTWWRAALQHISSIFVPLIPAFIGAGLISGVSGILKNMLAVKMLPASWSLGITVLSMISSALFSFLNIYVGINTAKEFGATPGLGGIIGGIVYLPGIVAPITIPNVFNGQPLAAGQGGIIGVLLAVWLMSYVEKFFHKHVWDSVDILITPFLTVLIMGLFTVFLIMPLAGWVSSSLVGSINWVLAVGGPFAGFVLGLFFLPMVMLGLHQILTPIHLEMIQKMGYTPLLPILAMAGAGQVGAAIALWIKCRHNKQLTKLIKGALPVGFLGVGEPLIYGVTLPLGRPFITACVGGGIGGAVIGMFPHLGAIAVGPSGLALIPLIANNMWWAYCCGLLAAYAGGFVATYFFGTPKSAMVAKNEDGTEVNATSQEAAPVSTPKTTDDNVEAGETDLTAVVNGQLEPVTDVKDDVFSKKMLGDGYAIIPSDGEIVAPADGKIVSVMPKTKHAITMKTSKGLELLIHMGLDTVELNGTPFQIKVNDNDEVKAGQPLATMDVDAIKQAGKDPVVIVTVTNFDHVANLSLVGSKTVTANETVAKVISK